MMEVLLTIVLALVGFVVIGGSCLFLLSGPSQPVDPEMDRKKGASHDR